MKDFNLFTIAETSTLLQAAEQIEQNRSRAVIILSKKKVLGIVSEGDILRALLNNISIYAPLSTFMEYSYKCLKKKDYHEAYRLMREHLFSLIPVVDEDCYLIDIITIKDIFKKLEFKRGEC